MVNFWIHNIKFVYFNIQHKITNAIWNFESKLTTKMLCKQHFYIKVVNQPTNFSTHCIFSAITVRYSDNAANIRVSILFPFMIVANLLQWNIRMSNNPFKETHLKVFLVPSAILLRLDVQIHDDLHDVRIRHTDTNMRAVNFTFETLIDAHTKFEYQPSARFVVFQTHNLNDSRDVDIWYGFGFNVQATIAAFVITFFRHCW